MLEYELIEAEQIVMQQGEVNFPYIALIRLMFETSLKAEFKLHMDVTEDFSESSIHPFLDVILNSSWEPSPEWPFSKQQMRDDLNLAISCQEWARIWSMYQPEDLKINEKKFLTEMETSRERWLALIKDRDFWAT